MNNRSKYNPHIHHRRSIRLKGYDYSREGLYFITICCQDKVCLFGDVVDEKMILNEYGLVAQNEWLKTPEIRPNVELGEFVVMPNHIHGIIQLIHACRGELHSPESHPSVNTCKFSGGECNSPLPRGTSQTVGAIVRGYKSAVTKKMNSMNIGHVIWQRNYHEHIIRNEKSYQRIAEYILNNPANWLNDKFYKNEHYSH
jgi:putative transposase